MKTNKKCLAVVIGLAVITCVTNAAYFGASVGYLIDSEDEIFSIQVGFPFSTTNGLSHNIEVEVGYIEDSEEEGSIDLTPVMLNYVFKTQPEKGYNFYAGGGIGYSFYDLSYMDFDLSGEILTWQLLAGVQYAVNESTSLKLGYRYIYLDDIEDTGVNVDDSIIEAGIVFNF